MAPLPPTGSNTARGILSMIVGGGALTTSDAATKWLTETLPIGEILFVRALVVSIAIGLILWRSRSFGALRIGRYRNIAARSVLAVVSTFLIVSSLARLPLNEVIAILFVGPLFVAILATPLLGERVGIHRWLAVLIGFTGMLIMVRPGTAGFQVAALLPVVAALVAATRDIVTRRISTAETSVAILFYSMIALTLVGLATAPFGWLPMDAGDIALLILTGLLFGLGHYFIIEGYRYAEATVVAPYRYANLIWAALLGFVLWGEIPSIWVLAGTPLVVGSGLYILLYERSRRRL
ncbi:MAG: DMT family transporter [Gammaproteobacteria bacterium]|nr:MAG: DMT family transporter [Gammaproteobacteria bacterium]